MIQNTPPMGWNTWNTFAENISDELIRQTADRMVASGLADAGYRYVVIDDCWALKERDEKGRLVPDPEKFPNGIKAVSDYVHSKGLKFGIYSCAGWLTCAGYPGSYDHEYIDAQTFAEWGVDLLKYDFCFHSSVVKGPYLYRRMGAALANCGREILLSACSWGHQQTHEWIKTAGAQMWRSTGDIFDSWEKIKQLIQAQRPLMPYHGNGCFNDMDMLVVGMCGKGNVGIGNGCTFEEYRTHFSVWSILGSPLMIGCDIRNMNEETASILMNREVIAVNQDAYCNQPYCITYGAEDARQVYVRLLSNGDFAVCAVNLGDSAATFNFGFDEIGVPQTSGKKLIAKDLWTGEEINLPNAIMRFPLQPHVCRFYRCRVV